MRKMFILHLILFLHFIIIFLKRKFSQNCLAGRHHSCYSHEKKEELNAEENPVYGVYQQTEAYKRLYSTNEAVDNNNYYS